MCKDRGVKVVISTDSHSAANLAFIRHGVTMARRGWLEKKDVINTLGTAEFLAALRPRPGAVSAPTAAPTKAAKKKSAQNRHVGRYRTPRNIFEARRVSIFETARQGVGELNPKPAVYETFLRLRREGELRATERT
jgi:hypothetical protein